MYPPMLGCIPDDPATRAAIAEAAGQPACHPYPGSVEGTCARCRCKLWVGPEQQRVLARLESAVTLCLPCAAGVMARHGDGTTVSLSDKPWPAAPAGS